MKNLLLSLTLVFSSLMGYAQVDLKDVSGSSQKRFKNAPKKIYISSFRIIYQMLYSQTEVAEGGRELGGGYRGKASTGLNMALQGLELSDLQELTDEIYQNYLSQLQTAGYDMISIDKAQKSKQFEGFERKQGGTVNEAQFPGLLTVVPTGYEYMIKRTTSKGKEKGRFNAFKLSSDIEDAIVSNVTIVVPFVVDAESGISKGLSKGLGGLAKIVVKPDLRLESESLGGAKTKTSYNYSLKAMAATHLQLKKDLDIPNIIEEKKYKASKASQSDNWGSSYGALTVFNVTDAYLENTYPISVDGQQYKSAVKKAADDYLSSTLDKLLSYANR